MPTISMFYGIIVRMYDEAGGQHHMPHIHALYAEHEAVLTLDGELIEGSLPPKKMRILRAWMDIHEEELEADWKMLKSGEPFFRIDPLK